MRRWISLAGLVFAAVLAAGIIAVLSQGRAAGPPKPQPLPASDYSYAGALAEQRLQQLMKQHHIPGLSAALIVDQEIAWQASYGLADIERQTPVTEHTVFKMWSLSKPFTAVEIMRLAEEGLVDLDAPIITYLPDLALQSRFPAGEPITIRHLLTHRSGLPRNSCVRETSWHMDSDALERAASSLNNCFLAYPTGSRYKYSNIAIQLLGYIIQDKRGQNFPQHMEEQLFEPIGMTNSAFWSTALPAGKRPGEAGQATGYEYYEGQQHAYEQYDDAGLPSSNLYATVHDLASFVKFLFGDGEAGGQQIVNAETLSAMFTQQAGKPADPQHMGLGWKISPALPGEKIVWHDGGPGEGIGSLIAMLPERKLGVVLVANSTSFEGVVSVPVAIELLEALLETAHGVLPAEPAQRDDFEVEMANLARFEGDYVIWEQIMAVQAAGDHLRASIAGFSFDLIPLAPNRFRATHWLVELGLGNFLGLPMDLREITIEFQPGADAAEDVMIVNLGDIAYEVNPRYPDLPGGPAAWEALVGKYERYERLPSGDAGPNKLGENEITIGDGRLFMGGSIGPIAPIDAGTIIILSGPFHGETMTYDPRTGDIAHQGFIYKPRPIPRQ